MVNVIGLGYIGLPTALILAANGVEVVGTDYNPAIVAELNQGRVTFKEEGLDELFKKAVAQGIKFSDKYQKTDIYIISVPTPYDACLLYTSPVVNILYIHCHNLFKILCIAPSTHLPEPGQPRSGTESSPVITFILPEFLFRRRPGAHQTHLPF